MWSSPSGRGSAPSAPCRSTVSIIGRRTRSSSRSRPIRAARSRQADLRRHLRRCARRDDGNRCTACRPAMSRSPRQIEPSASARSRAEKKAWEAELDEWTHERSLFGVAGLGHMHPRRSLRELEKAMPENAMVTTDIGNICSVSNCYLRFERPRCLRRHELRQLRLCLSDRAAPKWRRPTVRRSPMWATAPGASASRSYSPACARKSAIAVVFNNGQWGAEKKNHVDFYHAASRP